MAVIPEIQTIGLDIDLTKGKFVNTHIKDGVLELANVGVTYDGSNTVYHKNGSWESDVIDTVDKYKAFKNLAISSVVGEDMFYKAYTRTSDDNVVWEEYRLINEDGSIASTMNRYVQVKFELTGGLGLFEDIVEDFSEGSRVKYDNTDYVVFDGDLKLKRYYELDSKVSNHAEEGSIYVARVNVSKLKKIDSLNIDYKR